MCNKPLKDKQKKFCCIEHNRRYQYLKNRDKPSFKAKKRKQMREWYDKNREEHLAKVKNYQARKWKKFKKLEELRNET